MNTGTNNSNWNSSFFWLREAQCSFSSTPNQACQDSQEPGGGVKCRWKQGAEGGGEGRVRGWRLKSEAKG